MAPDMKRAILIVGVWCTVLTLWLVPAEPLPILMDDVLSYGESRLTPERQAVETIRGKARVENALLKRLRLVDSLRAEILSSSTGPVVVTLPPEASPEDWSKLSEAVRSQVEYLGAGREDMVVGVSYVYDRFGNHADFQDLGRGSADYFSGTVDRQSFCLAAYSFYASERTDERNRDNLTREIRVRTDGRFVRSPNGAPVDVLGPCSLHWVHGSPGPAIRQWLRDDGMSRLARAPWPSSAYPPIGDHRSMYGEWDSDQRNAGSYEYGRLTSVGEGCLAGHLDACRRAVLDPTVWLDREHYPELEDWVSSGTSKGGQPFGGRERHWMGDLEAEFGKDRFTRFWTSEQAVEDAFATAFGEPIEAWTMRWAQDRMGPQKAGPSTDLLSVLLTLVTLLACVGIATATAERWRV